MSSRWLAALFAAPLVLGAARARADDASDARAEYAAGTTALAKSAYRDAAEHFEVAARLRPHAVAYFAAGKAWQLAGELVRSADRLSAALAREELGAADKADALRRLAGLEEKLGTVAVTGDAAMEVQVDDGPPVHPTGARHGLPGKHTLFIRGPAGSTSREITLNAGGSLPVELSAKLVSAGGAGTPGPVGPTEPPPTPETPTSSGSGLRTAGIVTLVGAGVAAGVSVGLGVSAESAKTTFLASRSQGDFDSAQHLQTATNIGWAATAVLGAAGATMVIVSIVRRPSANAGLVLRPGGAAITGRF